MKFGDRWIMDLGRVDYRYILDSRVQIRVSNCTLPISVWQVELCTLLNTRQFSQHDAMLAWYMLLSCVCLSVICW